MIHETLSMIDGDGRRWVATRIKDGFNYRVLVDGALYGGIWKRYYCDEWKFNQVDQQPCSWTEPTQPEAFRRMVKFSAAGLPDWSDPREAGKSINCRCVVLSPEEFAEATRTPHIKSFLQVDRSHRIEVGAVHRGIISPIMQDGEEYWVFTDDEGTHCGWHTDTFNEAFDRVCDAFNENPDDPFKAKAMHMISYPEVKVPEDVKPIKMSHEEFEKTVRMIGDELLEGLAESIHTFRDAHGLVWPNTLFINIGVIKPGITELMGLRVVPVTGLGCHNMVALADECPDDLELGGDS